MYEGKYVLSQIVSLIPQYHFNKSVERYKGDYRSRDLKSWSHFIYLLFGQLTHRESVRDIITCLSAHKPKLYHLGIASLVDHSTLSRANNSRNWQIWADFAQYLISVARPLYLDDNEFLKQLDHSTYALDASTIDLCLNVFKWAKFRKKKGAVKLHTIIDLRGNIPVFMTITDGKDTGDRDSIMWGSRESYQLDAYFNGELAKGVKERYPEMESSDDKEEYKIVEQMPRFPGCEGNEGTDEEKKLCAEKKMLEYIYKNIKYPTLARYHEIQGMAVVQFVVEKDGSISGQKILRDVKGGCGDAALDIANSMPQWILGYQRDKPVRVQFNLPVRFIGVAYS